MANEPKTQRATRAAKYISARIEALNEKCRSRGKRARGLSMLSEQLGRYPSVVSRWASGDRKPGADGVALCARAIGCRPEWWTQDA